MTLKIVEMRGDGASQTPDQEDAPGAHMSERQIAHYSAQYMSERFERVTCIVRAGLISGDDPIRSLLLPGAQAVQPRKARARQERLIGFVRHLAPKGRDRSFSALPICGRPE